jgi:hypothetical protein
LKNEISSELGSLAYISRVLHVEMDSVVNILIILFIIVFDPLAICMVLAFNFMSKPEEDTKPEEEVQKEINFPKEEFVPYEPDFFVNADAIIEDSMADKPLEQPLTQPVQEPVIPIPRPRNKEEFKELKRQEIDRDRKENLAKQKLKENLYNEDSSKTY